MRNKNIVSWMAGLPEPFEPCLDPQLISQFVPIPEELPLSQDAIIEGLSQGEALDRHTIMQIVKLYVSHGWLDSVFLEKIYATPVLYVSDFENKEHIITHAIMRGCGEHAISYLLSPLLAPKIIDSFNVDLIRSISPEKMQSRLLLRLMELRTAPELMSIAKDIYSLTILVLVTPISERLSFLISTEMAPHVIKLLTNDQNKYSSSPIITLLELLPKQQHAEFCSTFEVEKNIEADEWLMIERCAPDLHQEGNMFLPIGLQNYSYSLLRDEIPNILNNKSMLTLNALSDELFLRLFNYIGNDKNNPLFQSEAFKSNLLRIARSSARIGMVLANIRPDKRLAFFMHELVQPICLEPYVDDDSETTYDGFSLFALILQSLPEADWDAFSQIEVCKIALDNFMTDDESNNFGKLAYLEQTFVEGTRTLTQFILSSPMKPYLDGFFDTAQILSVFLQVFPEEQCWELLAENKVIQEKYSYFVSNDDASLLFLRLLDLNAGTLAQRKKVLEITENAYQYSPRNEGLSSAQYQRFHFFHRAPLDADIKFIEALRESVQAEKATCFQQIHSELNASNKMRVGNA